MNGFFLILYQVQKKPRRRLLRSFRLSNDHKLLILTEGSITFLIVVFSWVMFRSGSIMQAKEFIAGIFSSSLFSFPEVVPGNAMAASALFILAEYLQRNKQHALQIKDIRFRALRWSIYIGVVLLILFFGAGSREFIYFQF
jgi:hypothetical protein